jgi:hypothetical protein
MERDAASEPSRTCDSELVSGPARFSRSNDAVLPIGGQLAFFEKDGPDARLSPSDSADPFMDSGIGLNEVVRPAALGTWLPRAIERDGRAYFARRSTAAGSELGVYAVDLTDPAALLPAGNAFLPAADGRAALDVIPTQGAMIVARGTTSRARPGSG